MAGPDEDVASGSGVLTVPNVVSMIRLAGVPLFLWLILVPKANDWALLVLALAGVSDYLDGYLARRLHQTSRLGALLDPVADRLYILSTVIGLGVRGIIPWWLAVLLPARDLLLWGLVPFLRRSPDPLLQLVPLSLIESIRGTNVVPDVMLQAQMLGGTAPPMRGDVADMIADANHARVTAELAAVTAALDSIAADRRATYAKVGIRSSR